MWDYSSVAWVPLRLPPVDPEAKDDVRILHPFGFELTIFSSFFAMSRYRASRGDQLRAQLKIKEVGCRQT